MFGVCMIGRMNEHDAGRRPVQSAPGYWVDACGRLYGPGRGKRREGRSPVIRSPSVDRRGYTRAALSCGGSAVTRYLHHLVWEAFRPESPRRRGMDIHHVDHNPRNNRLDNLELVTHAGNIAISKAAGHREPILASLRGRGRPVGMLHDGEVVRRFPSVTAAARWAVPTAGKDAVPNVWHAANGARIAYGRRWVFMDQVE